MKAPKKPRPQSFAAEAGRALRRAGVAARRTARMHGTPVYVWKNGKVVAEKPRDESRTSGNVFRDLGIPLEEAENLADA